MPELTLEAAKAIVDEALKGKADLEFIEATKTELAKAIEKVATDSAAATKAVEEAIAAMKLSRAEGDHPYNTDVGATPWVVDKEAAHREFAPMSKSLWVRDRGALNDGLRREKAINTNDATPGAREDFMSPYVALQNGNPIRRFLNIMAATGTSCHVPNVNQITFADRANTGVALTDSGKVTDKEVPIKARAATQVVAEPAVADVPGLNAIIEFAFMQAYANKQGADTYAVIQSDAAQAKAVDQTIKARVKSGVANKLPTSTTVIGLCADMIAAVGSPYLPGSVWQVSAAFYGLLLKSQAAAATEFSFDPATGVMTLFGYPVVRNDHFAGDAENGVPAAFGNFGRGIFFAERQLVDLRMYEQTNPGSITYFAQGRYGVDLWDPASLAVMVEKG